MLHEHGLSLAKHPGILRLFLEHLKERGPLINSRSQHRVETFAEIALHGIPVVLRILGLAVDSVGSTFLVPTFTQLWPDIWNWMKHFHSKLEPAGARDMALDLSKSVVTLYIIASICSSFRNSSADRAILSTPGVCSMVADIWNATMRQRPHRLPTRPGPDVYKLRYWIASAWLRHSRTSLQVSMYVCNSYISAVRKPQRSRRIVTLYGGAVYM